MAVKKWAVVVVAIVAAGFYGLVVVVGLGIYAFTSHVDIDRGTDEAAARRTFEEARARFTDQPPLLTMGADGPVVDRSTPTGVQPTLETLHVMAWEQDEDRLITLRIPMWLIRLSGDGNVDFDLDDGDLSSLELTLEDLERHGPGLVVDYASDHHDRVLIWTE